MKMIAFTKNDSAVRTRSLKRTDQLAALAREALTEEAELTPKPGLVDRRGRGAHKDLSLEVMLRSAAVLEPYFAAMGSASEGRDLNRSLRLELATIGRHAECAMYTATQGSNSHKGAIWILGLLVAASAHGEDQTAREIAASAGAIARLPYQAQPELLTHGDIARNRYGVAGARGEAANDFPHVVNHGLPTLRRQQAAGFQKSVCQLDALFSILSHLDDTCLLYRGGIEALQAAKSGARAVLLAGGSSSSNGQAERRNLDRELLARHVSPGGSADLLAATIFLDSVERHSCEVRKNQGEWEERDGAA